MVIAVEEKKEFNVVSASFVAGAPTVASLPAPALAEVAFAGRSNVGKSSLLNSLMQRRNLVRTSGTPGCTRQINVFRAGMGDSLEVQLIDLPGYGYAKLSKKERATWGPMLEGYLQERPTLRAVVVLLDARRGFEAFDAQMIEFLKSMPLTPNRTRPVEVVLVATKIDKLTKSRQKPVVDEIRRSAQVDVVGFSAETNAGREALWGRIRRAVLPVSGVSES